MESVLLASRSTATAATFVVFVGGECLAGLEGTSDSESPDSSSVEFDERIIRVIL